MGGVAMRYFRTTPEIYAQLQQEIDDAFRAELINSGRCEHILPVDLAPMPDGFCYMALPEWMPATPGAEQFLGLVDEVSESLFTQATQPANNL